jgi:protein-tyrosine phosphatase
VDVFIHPENHLICLPIEKIIADTKVNRRIVELYKRKIVTGERILAIVVIKNPGKDIYAVLDGHHRYFATLEMGIKEINCAFAGDFSGLVFTMAKYGFFQPATEIIEYTDLLIHGSIRHYFGTGFKDLRLFFQKLRSLSIGIFFTPAEWTSKSARKNVETKIETKENEDCKLKVLFVCTGNSYRSPLSEALLKRLRPDLEVDSAGTRVVGRISKEAKEFSVLEDATQYLKKKPESIDSKQLNQYDIIIAMEKTHRDSILKRCPECKNKIVVWNIRDKTPFFRRATEKSNNQMKKKVTEIARRITTQQSNISDSTKRNRKEGSKHHSKRG